LLVKHSQLEHIVAFKIMGTQDCENLSDGFPFNVIENEKLRFEEVNQG